MINKDKIFKFERFWTIALLVLCLPAFLINLGAMAFIEDESIRSIVALEMLSNGNFLIPTINGDFYYAKPPLYNWFLAASFAITGIANEWTARIPNLFFLALFAWTIFRMTKEELGRDYALLNAFLFLTCGRILFWDSFLALIDISYSWVTYISIMLLYKWRDKPWSTLIFFYILATIGYMLKGFPSIVFIIMSFFGYVVWKKDVKSIFHWGHIPGVFIFASTVIGYYYYYNQFNEVSSVLGPLLDQSTRRTPLEHEGLKVVKHFFSYPFENIYHFLPWSLFSLFLFDIKRLRIVLNNDFFRFNVLMFLANILAYWISPGVYPRYILMLVPIYFTGMIILFKLHFEEKTALYNVLTKVFLALLILLFVAPLAGSFQKDITNIPFHFLYGIICSLGIGVFIGLLFKQKINIWISMIAALIFVRIWFDLAIVPTRVNNDLGSAVRSDAYRIAETYPEFKLYDKARMDKTSSFYLAAKKGKANERATKLDGNQIYIFDPFNMEDITLKNQAIDSMRIREFNRKAYIIK